MNKNIRVLIILLVKWQAMGQAPEDFNSVCREGMLGENKNFSPDTQILLDTSDYFDLFENTGAVWLERDFDDDTNINVRLHAAPLASYNHSN